MIETICALKVSEKKSGLPSHDMIGILTEFGYLCEDTTTLTSIEQTVYIIYNGEKKIPASLVFIKDTKRALIGR